MAASMDLTQLSFRSAQTSTVSSDACSQMHRRCRAMPGIGTSRRFACGIDVAHERHAVTAHVLAGADARQWPRQSQRCMRSRSTRTLHWQLESPKLTLLALPTSCANSIVGISDMRQSRLQVDIARTLPVRCASELASAIDGYASQRLRLTISFSALETWSGSSVTVPLASRHRDARSVDRAGREINGPLATRAIGS